MLGYIKTDKWSLTYRGYHNYKSYYCMLCNSIRKKYGQMSGLLLSYDVSFISIILNSFDKNSVKKEFRCPLNVLVKCKGHTSLDVADYCAFINFYLALVKCRDDINDDNSLRKKMLYKQLVKNKGYKEDQIKYSSLIADLDNRMTTINSLESENADTDDLMESFGQFFYKIVEYYLVDNGINVTEDQYAALNKIIVNLGKWIYLIDAYDDLLKDKKAKDFNLLLTDYENDKSEKHKEFHQYVSVMCAYLVNNMAIGLKSLAKTGIRNEIINNICVDGTRNVLKKVIEQRYPEIHEECNEACCNCDSASHN